MSRPLPHRFYEPNILHNPLEWMGVWTPQGWRVHRKRRGRAQRLTIELSGDGRSTSFPGVLKDPDLGCVAWGDDLHLDDDPFTDGGIYPCDPRVEHPIGQPRWAVSHSILCYPVADHSLFTHEYLWDLERGDLHTRFREHVPLEAALTDPVDGHTVRVAHAPLSTCLEGNVGYSQQNSAVRGVWDNPRRAETNYYAERICQRLAMANGVYVQTPRHPVVQCHGLYATSPADQLEGLFDEDTGLCRDPNEVQRRLLIPFDAPKLGMLRFPLRQAPSNVYQCSIGTLAELTGVVGAERMELLEARRGARFVPGRVGYAEAGRFDGELVAAGYVPALDFNGDGIIDEQDIDFLRRHVGREVRYNLYLDAYFGGDWLSTSCCLELEHRPGTTIVADYEYGGGYDPATGVVRLL